MFQRRESETLVIAAPRAERRGRRLLWRTGAAFAGLAIAAAWWIGRGWILELQTLLTHVPD